MATSLVLVNERGIPQPPASLVERLRSFAPEMELRPYHWGNHYQWVVWCPWREGHKLWERVQKGTIPARDAGDIICWLETNVSLEDAIALFEKGLTAIAGARGHHVDAMLTRVRARNQKTQESAWGEVEEKLMEAAQAISNQANHAGGNVVFEASTRLPSAGIPGTANGPAVKDKAPA